MHNRFGHGTCQVCGKSLSQKRSDARFCGVNCRKQWSRRRENIEAAAAKARWEIGELRLMGKDYPDLRPALVVQLKLLQADIAQVLLMYDPATQRENAEKNELLIGISNRRF